MGKGSLQKAESEETVQSRIALGALFIDIFDSLLSAPSEYQLRRIVGVALYSVNADPDTNVSAASPPTT